MSCEAERLKQGTHTGRVSGSTPAGVTNRIMYALIPGTLDKMVSFLLK